MQEYWDIISDEHQEKLRAIAKKKGVDLDTAMRNIVNFLKQDQNKTPNIPEYFRDVITAKQIEEMIDMISGGE
jgi:hypothetical protein